MKIPIGERDTLITIQQRVETQDPDYGNIKVTWDDLADEFAEVQDILPSRAERIVEGISIAKRPCRIRMLYRDDINSSMRIKIDNRYLKIVAGPATLGKHEGLEIIAEELTTSGQEP